MVEPMHRIAPLDSAGAIELGPAVPDDLDVDEFARVVAAVREEQTGVRVAAVENVEVWRRGQDVWALLRVLSYRDVPPAAHFT
ncbi:MAG: hypothetical protein VX309_03205 [Pseudomonadota bacterium]|nr:hypothetical protein [Pseudomonadota bacterium]